MSNLKKILVALGIFVPTILVQNATAKTWETKALNGTSEQIHAATSETSSVALFCTNGELKSAISIGSKNSENVIQNVMGTKRRKTVNVDMFVNGEKVNTSRWIYSPKPKVFVPKSSLIAVKLYNAAVKGDPVSFKQRGRDRIDLEIPAPNSNFAKFGSNCGIGSKKS